MAVLPHYYEAVEPLECGPGGTDPNDPCPPPTTSPAPSAGNPGITPHPGTSPHPSNDPNSDPSHISSHEPGNDGGTHDVAPGQPVTGVPGGPMLPETGIGNGVVLITGVLMFLAGIVAIVVARSRLRRP